LCLAWSNVLSSRTWTRRIPSLAVTGVIALAIFLTMSRGALAAMVAIVFIFILRMRINWRLLLPVAVSGAALLLMPPLFFERMQEVSTSRIAGRQDIWQVGIHSLQSYGAVGAGLDNFSNAFQRYAGTSRFFAGDQRAAHNIYLTTAVEFGVVGMLLLFAALRSHLRSFSQPTRKSPTSARLVAFEAACWGMLVAGFTLDILWRKSFWFVWALSVVAMRISSEDEQTCDSNVPKSLGPSFQTSS
jgi:O-antigen ligase